MHILTVLRVRLFFVSGPRRISGVHRDEWGCAHWLRCRLCQKEREELKERLKQLKASCVLGLAEKKRRVAMLEADIKQAQFWYRAYDERITALMAERLPFVTANPYFIVVNCHAALTLELENPSAIK